MYNFGNELFQTTAVQQWQHVNVVGCHMVFSGLIGMFACDNLQIPSGRNALSCIPFPLQWTVHCTLQCDTISFRTIWSVQCLLLELFETHICAVWQNIKRFVTE